MILDKSGSMSQIRSDIIGSVNQFINDQKKVEDNSTFTFVTFSDNVETVYFKRPLFLAKNITEDDYKTSGSTSLFDAIGLTINKFEHDKDVIMVIVTDGQENASRKYNRKEVVDMIAKYKNNGWKFIYLSADVDTFKQGDSIGFGTSGYGSLASTGTCNTAAGYFTLGNNISTQCTQAVTQLRMMKTKID